MRRIYNVDDAYAAYLEQYNKIKDKYNEMGLTPLQELKKPQFELALKNRIKDIKDRGGKPSSKLKLAKTIANEYGYRTTAKEVAQIKEQIKQYTLKDEFGNRLSEDRPDVQYKLKTFQKMRVQQLRAYSYKQLMKNSGLDDAIEYAKRLAEEEGLDTEQTRKFISKFVFGSK